MITGRRGVLAGEFGGGRYFWGRNWRTRGLFTCLFGGGGGRLGGAFLCYKKHNSASPPLRLHLPLFAVHGSRDSGPVWVMKDEIGGQIALPPVCRGLQLCLRTMGLYAVDRSLEKVIQFLSYTSSFPRAFFLHVIGSPPPPSIRPMYPLPHPHGPSLRWRWISWGGGRSIRRLSLFSCVLFSGLDGFCGMSL